jgi:MFS family permease
MTLVALTSASLADVEPEIAGAASGLVNVSQQLGAAIGLAILVTVFNSVAGHAQLVPGATPPAAVHALHDVFAVAGLFALGALATVVFGVSRTARAELKAGEPEGAGADEDFDDFSVNLSALAAGDGDGEDRFVEPALSA